MLRSSSAMGTSRDFLLRVRESNRKIFYLLLEVHYEDEEKGNATKEGPVDWA